MLLFGVSLNDKLFAKMFFLIMIIVSKKHKTKDYYGLNLQEHEILWIMRNVMYLQGIHVLKVSTI